VTFPSSAELAEEFYEAVQNATNRSVRSRQADDIIVGVSDLGWCPERLRRRLDGQVPRRTDKLKAWIGTAIGDHFERAVRDYMWPKAICQSEVVVHLQGERYRYSLTGHPDIIEPDLGIVVDCKTVGGLSESEERGPDLSQQFQRHLYAKGAHAAGFFGDRPLDEVQVANVWIDRSGQTKRFQVDLEPFREDLVWEAARWLDEVVYAWQHDQEAEKVPPRQMCEVVCGYYRECRAFDTDVHGLIEHPSHLSAIDRYLHGKDLIREGNRLQREAREELEGVEGSTGKYFVRWVHINSPRTRSYDRLEVTAIPNGGEK